MVGVGRKEGVKEGGRERREGGRGREKVVGMGRKEGVKEGGRERREGGKRE